MRASRSGGRPGARPPPLCRLRARRRRLGRLLRAARSSGIAGLGRGRRARSASSTRRSRRATASPRSSSPSSGRLHPVGILVAGLLGGALLLGGENAQIKLGLPQAVTGVFQGMLLFFLLGLDFLVRYPRAHSAKAVGEPHESRADSSSIVLTVTVPPHAAAAGRAGRARQPSAPGCSISASKGMMLAGAVAGFIVARAPARPCSASSPRRHGRRRHGDGLRLPDADLARNQVATGLALTIFGIGL